MDSRAQAIEQVYRTRYVRFRNALATVTGSYDLARDAVQEGFARALAERDGFRGDTSAEGALEAWIWRIALRAALEARRRDDSVPLDDVLDPRIVYPDDDPALAAAVRILPPRRRFILFLRYFADLSYSQIATICGISEGTVASALASGREELHDALQTRDGEVDPLLPASAKGGLK